MDGRAYVVICFQQVVDLILCVLLSFPVRVDLIKELFDGVVVHDRPALIELRASNETLRRDGPLENTIQELDRRIRSPIALQRSLEPQASGLVDRAVELRIVGLQSLSGILEA